MSKKALHPIHSVNPTPWRLIAALYALLIILALLLGVLYILIQEIANQDRILEGLAQKIAILAKEQPVWPPLPPIPSPQKTFFEQQFSAVLQLVWFAHLIILVAGLRL
jgi:hypothetical protein